MAEIRQDRAAARRAQRRERAAAAAAARPQPQPAAAPAERRRSNFVAEAWAELKKVEWPGQNQVIQGTVVVLVACFVVGLYLYVNDQVWKQVVQKVLLGQ
ncbi:MAG TPA: preprotein translocase subunit SecE [Gaiellaceae bacterium]|nr:preprotein translocase subunit SecE [Gaiellaceae bacterium]